MYIRRPQQEGDSRLKQEKNHEKIIVKHGNIKDTK